MARCRLLLFFLAAPVSPLCAFGAEIAIDLNQCLEYADRAAGQCQPAQRRASGILLSMNETHPPDELVAPLKLSTHRGDLDYISANFDRHRRLGIRQQQLLVSDVYVLRATGLNSYSSLEQPPAKWPGDHGGNFTLWETVVEDLAKNSPPDGLDFDIWNEPMAPNYFWNRSIEQYYEMWVRGVEVIRHWRPRARIVGPSMAYYSHAYLEAWLRHANATDTLPDFLSWHEFGDPWDIAAHVADARVLAAHYYGSKKLPKISLNEVISRDNNFNPGMHAHYLASLERASVDSSCHACWGFNCAQRDSTGLHGSQSLDGLLTDDQKPRMVWWLYKAYAALEGELLVVNGTTTSSIKRQGISKDETAESFTGQAEGQEEQNPGRRAQGRPAGPAFDGVAAIDDARFVVRLVLGVSLPSRAISTSRAAVFSGSEPAAVPDWQVPSQNLTLRLDNVSFSSLSRDGKVVVGVVALSNSGAEPVQSTQLRSILAFARVSDAGSVEVKLPSLAEGDAAYVVVGRRRSVLRSLRDFLVRDVVDTLSDLPTSPHAAAQQFFV
eukprot:TRINITY_DN46988_c0_g1_i1.p1 TRINITY_DN46988_c0_g1~~TRINITY_DN46988_c0_g1_i1.p1  ORF type:complete len:551 (+),score=37.10 TRINITY_DN46988_c0_g1_i1:72-1724(+)